MLGLFRPLEEYVGRDLNCGCPEFPPLFGLHVEMSFATRLSSICITGHFHCDPDFENFIISMKDGQFFPNASSVFEYVINIYSS
jgi:hypothetical protein